MGTILSSKKYYNPVLARQPRKSTGLSKLEPSNSLQQHPLIGTLSIPSPIRISQTTIPAPTEPSVVNQPFESIQSVPRRNSSPNIIDKQVEQRPEEEEELIVQNSSLSIPMHNQTMNSDATIISRSVVNLNNHQRLNQHQLTSLGPSRTIVERNGKQFLTEFKERMERRYVQISDEHTGRMRLFEVTDYIPSRTVRSMRHNTQFPSQNGTPRNSFQSRQRLGLPPISNNRRGSSTPSNLLNFSGLNNRETLDREFNAYQSGADLPINNNKTPSKMPSQPRPRIRDSTNSQSQVYSSPSIASQNAPNDYTSGSYRPHSQTGSDYSGTRSNTNSINSGNESNSEDDDESDNRTLKSNNQNKPNVSYGTAAGYSSPTQLDPFVKRVNTTDHPYAPRPGVNRYSEPIRNNRGLQTTGSSDYAPIPKTIQQPKKNGNSRRKDSNSSAYDG